MKRKKLITGLVTVGILGSMLFTLSIGGLSVTQYEIDQLEAQKDQIAADKEALAGELSVMQTEQSELMAQKAILDQQNELTRQEIVLIDEQIVLYDGLIAEKEVELEDAIELEEYQKERLRERIRNMEENGDMAYVEVILEATSFSSLLTRMDDISEIVEYDDALEKKYIAAREETEATKAEYEEIQEGQLIKKDELEVAKAKLEADVAASIVVIQQLEAEIGTRQSEYDAFYAEQAALETEIAEMLAELEEQRKAAEEAAANGTGSGAYIGGTGTYIWPLPGYSPGSAYGWRIHPIYGYEKFHNGEDVGAPSGTPILAADSGTVMMATYNGGYGNYVMIDHGGGQGTGYAHMTSFAVSAGQTVTQGQVIGYVGSTGLSTGPHLHYETYVNGAAVDPKQYYNFG